MLLSKRTNFVNSPGGNTIAAAEHTIAMMLALSRHIPIANSSTLLGKWERKKFVGNELYKKKLGVVGLGKIGAHVAKVANALGMEVYGYDPFVSKETIESFGGKKVENLHEIVKSVDAISLHMPLNDKTKNIINYDLMKNMRKNCIIINAARGGIINEIDLNKALNENLIFGAGLDVFEVEPPDQNNPLLKNDKVFFSPHTAAFTEECMIRMGKETIQNIIDFFDKKLEKSKIIKL